MTDGVPPTPLDRGEQPSLPPESCHDQPRTQIARTILLFFSAYKILNFQFAEIGTAQFKLL